VVLNVPRILKAGLSALLREPSQTRHNIARAFKSFKALKNVYKTLKILLRRFIHTRMRIVCDTQVIIMGDYSTFLFARPSFAEGMARALDFGGTLQEYNRSITPEQADNIALAADIEAVNADFGLVENRSQQHEHPAHGE
jgi:hypothetical protein